MRAGSSSSTQTACGPRSASPEPSVIVEIGAGTGLFAGRFAAMAPDAKVFAVDTEPVDDRLDAGASS